MKKILLILGVLLTLANNASSNGASQPIPPESDNIFSSPQKGNNESEVLDSTLGPKTPDDSPEWYWANGKPVIMAPKNDEAFIIADHVRQDVKKGLQ